MKPSASTHELSDDELLTMMQHACFHYYWEGADPHSGMTRENIPGDDRIVATGASGFGIMSLVVGVDRNFITRDEGVERLTKDRELSRTRPALSRRLVSLHEWQYRPDHARLRHVR